MDRIVIFVDNLCRVPELEFLTQEHKSWKWPFR